MASTPSLAVAKHLAKPGDTPDPAILASTNARNAAVVRPAVGDVLRLLRLAKPHTWTLALALFALCVSATVNLGLPAALGKISVVGNNKIIVTCLAVTMLVYGSVRLLTRPWQVFAVFVFGAMMTFLRGWLFSLVEIQCCMPELTQYIVLFTMYCFRWAKRSSQNCVKTSSVQS
jgi:hypothetical protein